MSNYSENNDFEDILERLLANVSDDLDKRQGSIIYDALAPAAAELAQCYIALDVFTDQTYLLNAVGENLDNRVVDYGLTRNKATLSQVIIETYDTTNQLIDVDIGSRFSTPNEFGGYNYKILSKLETGKFIAECETAGSVGNEYIGELLPLVSINNLGIAKITSNYKPGEDEESDDDLRQRAVDKINQESFAGNKSSYQEFVNGLDGVEKCKIFPVWNGGGTVKVAIVSANNTLPSAEFINQVQEKLDPIQNQGQGIGIAPIGHTVTVEAPTQLDVNISAGLTLETGYNVEQLKTSIESEISKYIEEVQAEWEEENTLIIYTSKLIASILSISQVKNVSNLTINGQSTDLEIAINGTDVQFPILNEVILNEG